MNLWKKMIGGKRARRLARYERWLAAINQLEPRLQALSDSDLRARSRALRERARLGVSIEALLVEAYAVGREASRRTLEMRHFDVQLLGAMALHQGLITEMKTGEGKTLVATLAVYLNALTGKGVHLVTVNDYLAQRDAEWMGPLYRFLGLSVGVILEEMGDSPAEEFSRRRAAYRCDVTYGTNHEIAFDYLRDNLATNREEIVQRGFHYAIVDEVDFLLIDEARTPLIISGPAREDPGFLRRVDQAVRHLTEGIHYAVEAKTRTTSLTEAGFEAVQRGLGVDNLVDLAHLELYHAVHQSVQAHGVYHRDVDYIVEAGGVFIVDEFTGRVSEDKRYADGLHQAIEAKEGVPIKSEDQTLAKVTYQTFFGRYHKLAGMTGTAWPERQEFMQTYGLEVQVIPTHQPMIRRNYRDLVFDTWPQKHQAILKEILELRAEGQPVLVGTTSVRESEQLSRRLKEANVPHSVLNAKHHRAEAAIIAQAGRKASVTISTNMAGRGTDIILGGNPEMLVKQNGFQPQDLEKFRSECAREHHQVVVAGGLHVIGSAHHESVRVDDQLRGRAGRQGDPGSSQFIISLDDEIWKKFGKDQIAKFRTRMRRQGTPSGKPITSSKLRRILRSLQKKVEFENQVIRRDVLKYDLVVHLQRETIYAWRRTLVTGEGFDPEKLIREVIEDFSLLHPDNEELSEVLLAHFQTPFDLKDMIGEGLVDAALRQAMNLLKQREEVAGAGVLKEIERQILLQVIDNLWTDHLTNLERLEEGIGLRGYAQVDPLIEWRREATQMWKDLLQSIRHQAVRLWFLVEVQVGPDQA